MTITHLPLRLFAGAALAVTLAACGSDTSTSPTFGSGCNAGTIAPGEIKHSAFTRASCLQSYNFWSDGTIPYESWTVHLTAGKAYMFYEAMEPDSAHGDTNDVDALLSLWTTAPNGTTVPLAISDDDAEGPHGHDSQIWFIAPVSGTFQLVAQSYWGDEYGGYRLEAHECPVLAKLDTVGTYNLTLPDSPCLRIAPGSVGSDTAKVSMIAIPSQAFDSVLVSVSSAAFTPTWEMFGPGFDTYSNIYGVTQSVSGQGTGSSGILRMAELGGTVTLEVGSTTVDSSGAFSVTLARGPMPAAHPSSGRPWSISALEGMTRKHGPTKLR